jgi:glutathione synthase/RimK-type ligase-like ATP-grasp enzyme
MKKILIISGPYKPKQQPRYAEVLSQHINDYQFTDISLENLLVEISLNNFKITDVDSGVDIKSFDLVMVREYTGRYLDLAFVVSKYLQSHKVRFFNKDYLNYRPVSKLAQAAIFYELKLPSPAIMFSINKQRLSKAAKSKHFPLVLKAAQASHGENNYLLESIVDLDRILKNKPDIQFIVQDYIHNDHDYRVLMMNRKPCLQIRRRGQDDTHLNNTSKGAEAKITDDIELLVLKHAEKLADFLKVDLAGVDIMYDSQNQQYYFLEINFQPQIISGALIDEKMEKLKTMIQSQLSSQAQAESWSGS